MAMGRIGRGWRLARVSLGILRADKELLLLPMASLIITGVVWGSWVYAAFFALPRWVVTLPVWAYYGLYFVFYLLASFVVLYFNSAVVAAAAIRLEGRDPTLRQGLQAANARIVKVFAWAVVAATVGLALRAISERFGFLGRIIAGALGLAWGLATFFVIPVLLFEDVGPLEAVRRSSSLFKKTWGETVVGSLGLGLIFVLFGLLGLAGPILGVLLGGTSGVLVGLAIAVVYWFALALVASAAHSVLIAALYRFATTGQIPSGFPRRELAMPFGAP